MLRPHLRRTDSHASTLFKSVIRNRKFSQSKRGPKKWMQRVQKSSPRGDRREYVHCFFRLVVPRNIHTDRKPILKRPNMSHSHFIQSKHRKLSRSANYQTRLPGSPTPEISTRTTTAMVIDPTGHCLQNHPGAHALAIPQLHGFLPRGVTYPSMLG